MNIITAKIDVTKIAKEKLFQGKNGAKYLDVVLIPNRDGTDQYGNDFMVVQGVSKQEREAGVKGAILGNAKHMGQSQRQPTARPASRTAAQATEQPADDGDTVPF